MKTRKIVLSLLISVLMVASICLGVACEPKEVKIDLSTATLWKPAVAEGEEDIYKASNKDGALVLDFAKNDSYNATCVPFATFTVDELSKVKTLVVTAKMTTDAPYPALLFKVEGVEDKDAKRPGAVEVKVKATATETTYEWDFGYEVEGQKYNYDLTKVTRFLIFADPGVVGSSGKITISSIYLTDKDVTEANDATKKPAESGTAPAPVWNEVTATNMAIGSWVDGTPNNVYTVTKNTDNSYKVDVNKKVGAGQWDALVSYIHGDALATAKSFKLVVKGTKDKQILVKPFDNFEQRVTLTGENQEIVIDVHTVTEDATKDFSQKDAPTAENKVCIMGLPDVTKGTDTFTIISAEFSTEAVGPVVDPNLNVIEAAKKNVTKWTEPGDGAKVYTITSNDDGSTTVKKVGTGWQQLRAQVSGVALPTYNVVKIKLSGMKDVSFVINALGKEVDYDARENGNPVPTTNDEIEVVIDIPAGIDYANVQNIFFYMNVRETDTAKDTITIKSVEFGRKPVEITATNLKVSNWYDASGEDKFVVRTGTDGKVAVTKKVGTSFSMLSANVTGAEIANMKELKIKLSGVKNVPIIVKDYKNVEHKYENANIPTTDEFEITITLPTEGVTYTDSLTIGIMINWDATADYTFTIVSAEFVPAAPAA